MKPSPQNKPPIKWVGPAVAAACAAVLGWVLIKRATAGKKLIAVSDAPKKPAAPTKADDPGPEE
jgi:hypothetical protein